MALSKRQRSYTKRRAAGEGRAKAYKGAGYSDKQTDASAEANARKMEHANPAILREIERLQAEAEQGAIIDRIQRQTLLTRIALDTDKATADRVRAVDLLCKMSGDYTERVIYEGNAHVSIEDARREAWERLRGDA